MDSIAPPKPESIPLSPRPEPAETGAAAKAAQSRFAEGIARADDLAPDKLLVRLDQEAGRFVQTLSDANTNETLRRYPSEAQLAYSRAVMAYLRAQLGA